MNISIKKSEILFWAILINSIILLWDIQIKFIVQGIPLYLFILSIFGIFFLKISKNRITIVFLFFIINIFMFIIQYNQDVIFVNPAKTIVGLVIFFILVLFLMAYLNRLFIYYEYKKFLFKFSWFFLRIQLVLQITQFILSKLGMYDSGYKYVWGFQRVSGFFREPSHLAFSLIPFLYLYIIHYDFAKHYLKRATLFILIMIFLLSPSGTFIVLLGVIFIIKIFKFNFKNFLFSGIILYIIFVIINKISFVHERVYGVISYFFSNGTGNNNISALVFVKGFQMATYALLHYPLGVGILNLAFLNNFAEISFLSPLLYRLNADDGSSLAFKIIGEYGWLGFIFVFYSIFFFLKIFKVEDDNTIIKSFFIFGLLCAYLRGASYFDGLPILGIVVLINEIFSIPRKKL